MTARTLLNSLLQYKASADEDLLNALNVLNPEEPPPDFQSAIRVLNHVHIVDRIFVANLQKLGHSHTASWSSEAPTLAQLSSDIRDVDRWYVDYISRIGPDELEEVIDFTFTDRSRGRMSREEMLAHVIAHGGYHRGEVGRLVPQIASTSMRDVFAGFLHRSDQGRRQ